ncbi:GNAT family N-acetyltransferase [Pontivivens insulae]|uniref:N-acetyltransferase domain-containing protein n=1 Tax=Pontivivens insulae TaxID=1639689 RepID=A0A2R8A8K2_9RHOB|nr:GNAT family protein [Pontivivens insulae]RED18653.1 RimJ/RimL family protein N-acetyltransferase [Pontivivens insulae]SPF28551.1 hypothetical protein POI8812_00852 [Pontivivens insulae]
MKLGEIVENWQGARVPERKVLTGRYARVEPLEARHFDDLWAAYAVDREGAVWRYLMGGPFEDKAAFRDYMADKPASSDPLFFAFVDVESGRAMGFGSYLRINPEAGSIEVGHLTYSPAMQRTRMATEAMYLMMREAFELGYRRYEWKCNALNTPSRRAAERLGFTFEGVHRQALVTKGRNRDTAWFSVLDGEWEDLRGRFERWLEPGNFDENGVQRNHFAISC